jgi:hypothetical protein
MVCLRNTPPLPSAPPLSLTVSLLCILLSTRAERRKDDPRESSETGQPLAKADLLFLQSPSCCFSFIPRPSLLAHPTPSFSFAPLTPLLSYPSSFIRTGAKLAAEHARAL